jgi:hypothetical protein
VASATTLRGTEAFSMPSSSSHHAAVTSTISSSGRSYGTTTPCTTTTTVLLNMANTQQRSDSVEAATSEVQREASEKLNAVGWSMPTAGELTSDDPFVLAIDAGIQRDVGVSLESLLNPAKVVNLERDLYELRTELATLTGRTTTAPRTVVVTTDAADDDNDEANPQGAAAIQVLSLTTAECDGGGGGEAADMVRSKIAKKEADLQLERRSVFRGWLKQVFLLQAVLSFGISYVMATNPQVLFGQFDWFNNANYNMDISITVLGYWWWWLFVVPSLRSRRPKGAEKKALDWAFIGTPLISLLMPAVTKDTGVIWSANFAVVVACYAVAYLAPDNNDDDENDRNDTNDDSKKPAWLQFIYKSLDFGSGRERGARN